MKKLSLIALAALGVAGAAAAGVATARPAESEDAALLARATVPIATAISTAETESHGHAVEVSLEEEHGGPAWIVTTIASTGDISVEIDARTGAVKEIGPDDEDEGEEHEGHEGADD